MNPFLHDTVAVPLAGRPAGRWQFPFTRGSRGRLSRQAGVVAVTAMAAVTAGVVPPAHALDVNAATQTQLQSMRGVGPRTAQIIVDERTRAGRFESLEDLSDRVRGIGRKRLQALQAAGLRVGTDRGRVAGEGTARADGAMTVATASARSTPGIATPLLTTVSPNP